jgi:hypothetical protein
MPKRPRHNRLGRNDLCPCGSGRKYKLCCCGKRAPIGGGDIKQQILREIMPNIATMWVASDLFAKTLTWAEAREQLAKINRESALITMAMLNAVCAEFLSPHRSRQEARAPEKVLPLVNYLFAPEHRPAAIKIWQQSTGAFLPIAPPASTAMTEACMRYCDPVGGVRFEQPWQYSAFAYILLSFQDGMMGDCVQKEPINFAALTEQQFSDFARNYQTANFNSDLLMLMRRHYLMFERTGEGGYTKERLGISPAEWFTRISGMDPRQYRMLQLVALSHGNEFTLDAPNLTKLVYDLDVALGNMVPSVAGAYRRLHELAVATTSLPPADIQDWSTAIYHANYVRRRPVLRLQGEKYLCLHKQLLVERFFSATVHVLADLVTTHQPTGWPSEPDKRTLQVRTEFGTIFEDYVQRLIQILFQKVGAAIRFNLKSDAGGERDALVVINETALVFEVVHHPWSVTERARALPADFIKHLSENISRSVKLCVEITTKGALADDPQVKVRRAIPIVVMSEAMPINEMTAPSLQSELEAIMGAESLKGTKHVLPVQSLSVAQLENLDRVWKTSPVEVIPFLEKRSCNLLARFAADSRLGVKLGSWHHIAPIDEEAQRELRKYGSGVFRK